MKSTSEKIDVSDQRIISIFQDNEINLSEEFERKVINMAHKILEECLIRKKLFNGHFQLMAAASQDNSFAAELIDESRLTKLSLFESKNIDSPYLIKLEPLGPYLEMFKKLLGSTIIFKYGNQEVFREELSELPFIAMVKRDLIDKDRRPWSYLIINDSSQEETE